MTEYKRKEARDWAWEHLRGQWTTLVTPFTLDDQLDEVGLRSNMRHIRALGTRGAGCTWGMGEFWSLTQKERLRVYDIVADEAAGDWFVGAHVTHTSVHEMLDLASHAEDVGFNILIVAAPYMMAKTERQVVEFVQILSDNTSLAIMFYNSPQFGIVMSAHGLREICKIPGVVGVKEASFNHQLSIDTHVALGNESIISTPDEWVLFKGRELGFQQQVMFANTSDWRFDSVESSHYVPFINRATMGHLDDSYYDKHIRPLKQISDKWWRCTVERFGGSLPVPMVKYWGELMGMAGGNVRQPFYNLSKQDKFELKRELGIVRDQLVTKVNQSK